MLENGFEPDFPPLAEQQLLQLAAHPPQAVPSKTARDLRNLLWSSIGPARTSSEKSRGCSQAA